MKRKEIFSNKLEQAEYPGNYIVLNKFSSNIKIDLMQELIDKLTEKAGISAEQARTAINTIKDFIKEKFPMMAGAVDNFFPGSTPVETMNTSANKTPASSITTSGVGMVDNAVPADMSGTAVNFAKGLFGDK